MMMMQMDKARDWELVNTASSGDGALKDEGGGGAVQMGANFEGA